MDLQEQVTSLTAEKNRCWDMLKTMEQEKIALDQSYVSSIRECLELRKQIIIKDNSIKDLNDQIQKLLKENNSCSDTQSSEIIHEAEIIS